MYLIVNYDVRQEKCQQLMKLLRQYLFHIQNSLFEGELTAQTKNELIEKINQLITKEDGTVIIYILPSIKPLKTINIGNNEERFKIII